MNQELNNHLNHLTDLFETARDHQKSDEARRVWRAARESVESLRSAHGSSDRLLRIGACLESLDSLVRCWALVGFQSTFRVAGAMLEQASIDRPAPTSDRCIPAL